MGQKVNPVGFRTGVMVGWKSRWYASKQEFADLLVEDQRIRKYVKGRKDKFGKPLYPAISKIEIERTRDEVKVVLFSARPGTADRRKGERVEELQKELQEKTGRRINIKIEEINRPEIVAQLVAEDIAEQLEKRAELPADDEAGDGNDDGGGGEGDQDSIVRPIGRRRNVAPREADSPAPSRLSTLRAKIDYGFTEALIAQGHIGVQVWINQGTYSEGETDGADAQAGQAPKKPKRTYKR